MPALLLGAAACDSGTGLQVGPPAALLIVAGDQQSAVVGTELPDPLVVRVVDSAQHAVRNQVVNFKVTAGGGSVFAGVALTDSAGEARERWTLGTVARDTQRVQARAVDPQTGEALVFGDFVAIGLPDTAASVQKVAGDQQQGSAGIALPDSLAVLVTDRYHNAVPGRGVSWQVVAGGGAVSPASGITDASGIARTSWTLGGRVDTTQAVVASVANLTPVMFRAQAGVAGATVLSVVSGDNQSAWPSRTLPDTLVVELKTGSTPVAGAQINWTPTKGLGSVSPSPALTDAAGRAKVRWTLGAQVGSQGMRASVAGAQVPPVDFRATGVIPYTRVVLTGLDSVRGVNNRGQVAGAWIDGSGHSHAVLWDNGVVTDLGKFADTLATDAGATAVNDSGHVVGWVTGRKYPTHSFIWKNGVMVNVGGADPSWGPLAYAVNDSDQVAGYIQVNEGGYVYNHTFLWQGGVMVDLGRGLARGINNQTQIVGHTAFPPTSYDPHAALWHDGTVVDLGALPGGLGMSWAYAVNDSGVLVGYSYSSDRTANAHAVRWTHGLIEDLGTLGRDQAIAYGVNNAGTIVGWLRSNNLAGPTSLDFPFVLENGLVMELDSLPGGTAVAVNDSGDVVGVVGSPPAQTAVLWRRQQPGAAEQYPKRLP